MRSHRLPTFLSGVLVAAGSIVAAERLAPQSDSVLRCSALVLEDADGVERGRWGINRDGTVALEFVNSNGQKLIEVLAEDTKASTQTTSITIFGEESLPRFVMSNHRNQHGNANRIVFLVGDQASSFSIEEIDQDNVVLRLGTGATGHAWLAAGRTYPQGPDFQDTPPNASLGVSAGGDRISIELGELHRGLNPEGPHVLFKEGDVRTKWRPGE